MTHLATVLAAVALGSAPSAPTLVADLNQTEVDVGFDFVSGPGWTRLAGVTYFFADDGVHGSELWRSDGSPLGTFMIRDVCPGRCSGSPDRLFVTQTQSALGHVFFAADDGVHGIELWRTDGTALGTEMVRDILVGIGSSRPRGFTELAGQLFFTANDGTHGRELWRTDGLGAGTTLAWDATVGAADGVTALLGGPSWLWVQRPDHELWRWDGSPSGTFLVGTTTGSVSPLRRSRVDRLADGRLVFASAAGLVVADGIGPNVLIDPLFQAGSDDFVTDGTTVLYVSNRSAPDRSLYRNDTTGASPVDTGLGSSAAPVNWGPLAELPDGTVVATAVLDQESEVWAIAPNSNPVVLADPTPPPASSIPYWELWVSVGSKEVDGGLVYFAEDAERGNEPWFTDGTPGGTVPLAELVPGPGGVVAGYSHATAAQAGLDGALPIRHMSREGVWFALAEAPPSGARNVRLLNDQQSAFSPIADAAAVCRVGLGAALITTVAPAWEPADPLFRLSAAGVETLVAATADLEFPPIKRCGRLGERVVALQEGTATPLWSTDGTAAGTTVLAPVDADWDPVVTARHHDVVWTAQDSLWRSDGTTEGTAELVATPTGTRFAASNGDLVLFTTGLLRGNAFEAIAVETAVAPIPLGDQGFLVLSRGDWQTLAGEPISASTIGLSAGPDVPTDLWSGQVDSVGVPRLAAPLDEASALLVVDDAVGPELWRTDGTLAGSSRVRDIAPGLVGSDPTSFVQVRHGLVAFVANDGVHGRELWLSDGTSAGTFVVDLAPGPASSSPTDLFASDGVLLFSAWNPTQGREAWVNDGTPSGTSRLSDIATGPASSSPHSFVRAGRRLYFLASDHSHGYEWWSLDLPAWAPIFADGFESGSTAAWSPTLP